MDQTLPPLIAWTIVALGYVLPLAHVALARDAGPWRGPKTGSCPFSPRVGWLVMVLLMGVFGWLLFMRARRRKRLAGADTSLAKQEGRD